MFLYHRLIIFKNKLMLNRAYDFSNLDLFSCQDLDNYGSLSPEKGKPLLVTSIPANYATTLYNHEEFFYQKSTQSLVGCYEISFEKDFMKEHQRVFEKGLQNFMESFRIYSNKNGGQLVLQNQLLPKPEKQNKTCIEFMTAQRLPFSHEQAQNFVGKFKTYEKLCEFLNIVVSASSKTISTQLIQIAKELLEKYQSLLLEDHDQALLLNLASEVAKNPKFTEFTNLKEVNLIKCKEATALIEESKNFMEAYCATTILVIAQYFQNPYSSEETGCFKRQLCPQNFEDEEQEQEEMRSTPAKKRKYSF